MHEYLHNYLENIKKLQKKFSIRNMRPLSNARPPGRGVRGVLPPALAPFDPPTPKTLV